MSPNLLRAAAALAMVAALSSCGSTSHDEHAGHHPASVSQSTDHNAADVAFAQGMLPHHRQAVDLAAMVPSRTTNPDVRMMATHISWDQQAEILTMTGMLAQWGEPVATNHDEHGGMTMPGMPGMVDGVMPGMVDDATMTQLKSLSGPAFDELWLTSMIDHHQGAVTMAHTEIADGQNPDAKKLAEMIITAQQREIAQMNNLVSATE
ncbi:MAG: hypothetical protein JWR34_4495 [Mycobacterium sp.]|nr:hypothetical protein [Mycobacterium sp.]